MDIHVDKESEVPLHEQIAAQLVFLIGTGKLKPGACVPSVRALAQRLGINRNTVSRAYHDVTLNRIAERRSGRRLMVRSSESETLPAATDLDDLVHVAVSEAQRRGYSIRQLHERLRDRLLAVPPDHLLVLSDDAGMRMLFSGELKTCFTCPVEACTPDELLSHPDRGIGAQVVSPQGHIPKIRCVLPAERRAVVITYSSADEYLRVIRGLKTPSLIAVVSVSPYFLEMARGLMAPAVGRRHSVRGYLVAGNKPDRPGAADVLVCDSLTYPVMRSRYRAATVLAYRLLSAACLHKIGAVMEGHSSGEHP